ncbi:uncharacterized protein LOC134839481 [Symsagittifera roscoffensis]|uniref:uncharacterized protein LOC134839481 n=1 Tax=Symsagittifera roscoffensis TaxID=84072 RepID=UPI00307B4E06
MGVNEEEGGFGGIKTPRVVLIVLMVFSGLVMVGSGIAHGPWFKCNDVIRYGVWRWCASYIYFRYVAPNDRMQVDDYVLAKGVRYGMDDDTNFMDNTHICRGYANELYYENPASGGDVPGPIIVGRTFILATHVTTLVSLMFYFLAYADKLWGPTRAIAVLLSTIAQCMCFSVFCITMEAYLDGEETLINRTVVCWNGIIAWIGWCLSVLQIPVSFAYFKLDDGKVDEIIYQGYPHDDVMSHPSMTHHSQRGGGGNYGGGYKSAGSLMFGTTSPPPNDGFFDNNGGGNSQNGQYDSRVYNDGDMYA